MPSRGIPISGKRLREVRLERRMTTQQLAELTGCKQATIRHLESGYRKPSIDLLGRLEKALGVTADDLEARVT